MGRIPGLEYCNNVVSCLDTRKDPKGEMMDGWIHQGELFFFFLYR